MLLNVNDLAKTVAALLDDPSQSDFDKDYVLPFLNLAWNDLAIEMSSLGLKYEEAVVVLANVPANTTDLSAYETAGGLLQTMLLPVKLEWKRTTDPDTEYKQVHQATQLPDPAQGAEGVSDFEWRGSVIYITKSSVAVDLRVRFQAYSVNFVDPSDGLIVGAGNIIAYKAAEIICSPPVRNNQQGSAYFANKGEMAKGEFESLCVKQKNRSAPRIGRMSGRTRRGSRYIARV